MVVGMGGIRLHPLWMDAMEEVVWMCGLWVHHLRMHRIRNMSGVGGNRHPHSIGVMENTLSWSKVTHE